MKVGDFTSGGRRPTVSGWVVAPCLLVVAAIIAMLQFLEAMQASPDQPGSPSWTLLLVIACAGAAGLAVLLWRDARRWALAVPYVLAIVTVTVVTSWGAADGLYLSAPSYLQHAPGPMATAAALDALHSDALTCVTVHDSPARLLPPPYQRCVADGEVDYYYGPDPSPGSDQSSSVGLIFRPDGTAPETPNECVTRLSHSWWAEMGTFGAGRPCAPPFQFVGAP